MNIYDTDSSRLPSVVSIVPVDSMFKITWIMKETQTLKIVLPEENYTLENSNEIFVNASEIIEQIKILDCSEDITIDYELTSATFNFSK